MTGASTTSTSFDGTGIRNREFDEERTRRSQHDSCGNAAEEAPASTRNGFMDSAIEAFGLDLRAITASPRFQRSRFGFSVRDCSNGAEIYEQDGSKLFQAASTTKIPTCATALAELGPQFRFRTRVRARGPISRDGVLDGDLIFVASGDAGLTEQVVHDLAKQIYEVGLRRVRGGIVVDRSLFSERTTALGTLVSPVTVNDNLIELLVAAPAGSAAPIATFTTSVGYARVANEAVIGAKGSQSSLFLTESNTSLDGMPVITLRGALPQGALLRLTHEVRDPSRFAARVLEQGLAEYEIAVDGGSTASLHEARTIAEYTSPCLLVDVRVILKTSHNLHADILPSVIGAAACCAGPDLAYEAGFDRIRSFVQEVDPDLGSAIQNEGSGNGYFTPSFMTALLVHIGRQPFADSFRAALPALGKDGTLRNVQVFSPAVGHVSAKTGTIHSTNQLDSGTFFSAKSLAGYVSTAAGRELTFAAFLNNVAVPRGDGVDDIGDTLGQIATAAFRHL